MSRIESPDIHKLHIASSTSTKLYARIGSATLAFAHELGGSLVEAPTVTNRTAIATSIHPKIRNGHGQYDVVSHSRATMCKPTELMTPAVITITRKALLSTFAREVDVVFTGDPSLTLHYCGPMHIEQHSWKTLMCSKLHSKSE